ncbi:MAG: C4-dicarboxylate ABC transporter substrate-binding protein, partial [Synergistaceae bacterium]|nr:C4-dicarboxylate ABC transporter substrate-binding protein [Synergistaceae bacterium]
MRKIFAAVLAVMVLAGCAFADGMPGGKKLVFTTGGAQGTYYGFGGVLAGKVGEKTSTTITAITSGGSKANIE